MVDFKRDKRPDILSVKRKTQILAKESPQEASRICCFAKPIPLGVLVKVGLGPWCFGFSCSVVSTVPGATSEE